MNNSDYHFQIDLERLIKKGMKIYDPHSFQALKEEDRFFLSGNDRLFYALYATRNLKHTIFSSNEIISKIGFQVNTAHVIISGKMNAFDGKNNFKLGAGSVIGLCEGIAGFNHYFTVTAEEPVHTHEIPFQNEEYSLFEINQGIKGIFRSIISRTLSTNKVIEKLKDSDPKNIDEQNILNFDSKLFKENYYKNNEKLFSFGEIADNLHYITSGKVALFMENESKPFVELNEGEIIGEMCFLEFGRRTMTSISIGEVNTLSLSGTNLKKLLINHSLGIEIIFEAMLLQMHMMNTLRASVK